MKEFQVTGILFTTRCQLQRDSEKNCILRCTRSINVSKRSEVHVKSNKTLLANFGYTCGNEHQNKKKKKKILSKESMINGEKRAWAQC